MNKIQYAIDRVAVVEGQDKKSIILKGWAIGENVICVEIYSGKNRIYKGETNIRRLDVEQTLGLSTTSKCGFEIKALLPVQDNDDTRVTIAFLDKNTQVTKEYSIREIIESEPRQILFNIDNVIHEFNKVIIRGWAFSTLSEIVDISLDLNQEYKVKNNITRTDVKNAFVSYPWAASSGFEVVIENTSLKKAEIKLTDGTKVVNHMFYINESKAQKIMRKVNRHNIKQSIKYLQQYGISQFVKKVKEKLFEIDVYTNWFKEHQPTQEELRVQQEVKFEYQPLVSVIVPLYNTPQRFLKEMIDSVIMQSYQNWELCTVDASDVSCSFVEEIVKEYIKRDNRIKYKKLDANYGIAENTNRALEISSGEYILLFDHDDLLMPNALFEVVKELNENKEIDFIYSDEDNVYEDGKTLTNPHFKPDWSPYTLRSYNYITHIVVFKRTLMEQVGIFRKEFDGSQDHDMVLRLTERAKYIKHISKILYHWRIHSGSVASGIGAKEYALEAGRKAVQAQLDRNNIKGEVVHGLYPCTYKVNYEIANQPLISIIIPNKDSKGMLSLCIESILEKSTYKNYEIIIVENNSSTEEIFGYYEQLKSNSKIKVVYWKGEFNYSAINNFGFKYTKGDYIVLLNNDIEVITPNWLEEMVMLCQQKDVGAVGAKLYFEDDTVQHAGVILGIGGIAGHSHKGFPRESSGYVGRLKVVQNLSAVTAACLMCKREIYDELNGLDEGFKVALNDVDFCMRIRKKGYYVLYTPYSELYHYESKTRGYEDTPEKIERYRKEKEYFFSKWSEEIQDPFYNINLTYEKEDFSLK